MNGHFCDIKDEFNYHTHPEHIVKTPAHPKLNLTSTIGMILGVWDFDQNFFTIYI